MENGEISKSNASKESKFLISSIVCVSLKPVTQRNSVELSVRRATLLLAVSGRVIPCSPSYPLHRQCLCVLPASSAINAARLHLFLGGEYVWDEGIILSTRSWLPSFPWASLPLLQHKLDVHLPYDREPGTDSCCYQNTTPSSQLAHVQGKSLTKSSVNYPGEVNTGRRLRIKTASYEGTAGFDSK